MNQKNLMSDSTIEEECEDCFDDIGDPLNGFTITCEDGTAAGTVSDEEYAAMENEYLAERYEAIDMQGEATTLKTVAKALERQNCTLSSIYELLVGMFNAMS